MRKFICKVLTGAMTMAVLFCAAVIADPDTASAKVKVSKVSVKSPAGSKKKAYVAKGKSISLSTTVTVKPNKSKYKKVSYKSANKKIATVTSKGAVKGKKAGTTKITVTSKKNKKKKAVIKVTVKKAAVKKVKLSAGKAALAVNAKKTLKATVTPTKNTYTKVLWKTSNKNVATVSSKGVVTGKAEGTATITATAADGSKKKATCKVTVGASLSTVSVPHERIVRISLTSAKELKASDIVIQTKSRESAKYAPAKSIEGISSTDQKNYDVVLDCASGLSEGSWVKVTVNSLVADQTKEYYINSITGYGDMGNETISYVTGYKAGNKYDELWSVANTNTVGTTKITDVNGLPEGLKAYISRDGGGVRVSGKFTKIENGTITTLSVSDEEGNVFTKKYVFYVGDDTTMVGYVPNKTAIAYVPDDPKTAKNESGGTLDIVKWDNIVDMCGISGGSGEYSYKLASVDPKIGTLEENGCDINPAENADGTRAAIPAGDYPMNLIVSDSEGHTLNLPFTLKLVNGVTVKGTVRDAAGAPAKNICISGHTRRDAYGVSYGIDTVTDAAGTYETKVVPGDYCMYAYWDCPSNSCGVSLGNDLTSGTAVKDFNIPLYYVSFTTDIPGAKGYCSHNDSYVYLIDSYGNKTYVDINNYGSHDRDYSLYAYLRAGSYELSALDENIVEAYGGLKTSTDSNGLSSTSLDNETGLGNYKLSGHPFQITGNTSVALTAVKAE